MKRKLIIIMCLMMAMLAFAACGSDSSDDATTDSGADTKVEDETPYYGNYLNNDRIIEITDMDEEKSMSATISFHEGDDFYEGDFKYNSDNGKYEDKNLAITIEDENLIIENLTDEGEAYAGDFTLEN